ncbi:MAG: sulfite exporter TauE/SafE family protein [Chitinophagales bacterium]
MEHWELLIFFFGIAVLYSSVGFGGGSSYLAILALYSIDYRLLRATALLCNIIVVSGGTYIFYKKGFLNWRKMLPLVLISVPMAYIGGSLHISQRTFFILLSVALILAAILMLIQSYKNVEGNALNSIRMTNETFNAGLGGGIGFLSGMVGIGGGIFLAPVLHLLKWDGAKTIAATASFFILVNSISGLAGQMSNPEFKLNWEFAAMLMGAVFVGGQIGSRLGAVWFSPNWVRRLTAVLILFVGVRILLKYL